MAHGRRFDDTPGPTRSIAHGHGHRHTRARADTRTPLRMFSAEELEELHRDAATAYAAPPPPPEQIVKWYDENEAVIEHSVGKTFPGPHSTNRVFDVHVLPEIIGSCRAAEESKGTCHICDLGSGSGGLAVHVAQSLKARDEIAHIRVTGVTLTQAAVNNSSAHAAEQGVSDEVRFVTGDFHKLDPGVFPDKTFDAVVMNNSLCHSTDLLKVLLEIRRVLRPGGSLFVKDFHVSPEKRNMTESESKAATERFARNFHMGIFARSRLVKLMLGVFGAARYVRLGEQTDDGMRFARSCFQDGDLDSGKFSDFGQLVLNGFSPTLSSLENIPFEEGLWVATLEE